MPLGPRLRSDVVAAALAFVATAAVGFVPLFGGPGYEQSLAAGILVPSMAAVGAARAVRSLPSLGPVAALSRGAALGAALVGITLFTALLHGARVGFCDPLAGTAHFLLTAGLGIVAGGVWGALVGLGLRRRTDRASAFVALALLGPLGSIALSVARFYATPIIFAFDPFVGYFSGTLYDTVVDAGPALLTYRLETVLALAGAFSVASALAYDERGAVVPCLRVEIGGSRAASGARAAVGAVLFGAVVLMITKATELGHVQTAASITEALGGERRGERCTVIYPRGEGPIRGALLLRDCEAQLALVEATLGARGPQRITAFFFRDSAEKRRLMGAAETYIAKPWRAEVYLQLGSFPHPVLGHELAHVVAGSFGRGPFRIAGALGGFWPNPGLIEGVAVAASPDEDELTDAQWARAMLEAGILPRLESVFGMGFLTAHASKSYTLAGAFLAYALETRGAAAVRRWYGGASPEDALGKALGALDDEFRAYLGTVPMPDAARTYAKARFERKGVFARHCPHVVDALRRAADVCREEHGEAEALVLYDRALRLDAGDAQAQLGRALTLHRAHRTAEAIAELTRLEESSKTSATTKDRAREMRADILLQVGNGAAAAELYTELASRMLDEDAARTLEVKALAAESPRGQSVLLAFLVGTPEEGTDTATGFVRLAQWWDADHAPVAAYLLAKNLAQRLRFDDARVYLEAALELPAPTDRIGRELVRVLAAVSCARADAAGLALAAELVARETGPFAAGAGGRRASVERMLRACATH